MKFDIYQFKRSDAIDFARHMGIQTWERNDNLHFKKCPYCGGLSQDTKTFAIDLKTGMFKCLRDSCGASGNMITLSKDFDFSLGNEVNEYIAPKKKYRELKTPKTPIVPKEPALEYLASRGISKEVAEKYEITVCKDKPNVLVFPFYDDKGKLEFVKYRKTDFDKEKDNAKEWCEANCKPILFGMKQCNMDNKTLVLTEGQCFNGDAEIMTPNGWIRLEEYAGQEVLQVNSELQGEFVKPKAYICKRYIGDMIEVGIGGNYFTSTTPDHNLVFLSKEGEVLKKQAADKIPVAYRIPTTINFNGNGCELSNDELALLLAISADGTIDVRKDGSYYVRFGLMKQRKVDRLLGILERLNYKFSDSILTSEGKKYHSICFRVCNKQIAKKFLPWSLVTDTSLEQKKFLIKEMVWWDGNHVKNRNQYEYVTIYKRNADVMQAIASTCGYMSTIMKKKSGGNGIIKESYCWKVSILLRKNSVTTQRFEKNKSRKYVDKSVYCVTVDSGMILVRQDNKISVSGNCDTLATAEAGIENSVSVPTGSKGFTWIPYCWDFVHKFETIIVFGDCEKGHITLLDDIQTRFHRLNIKHVRMDDYRDCKDANEILLKYGKEQIVKCIENAESLPINNVMDLADVVPRDLNNVERCETGIKDLDFKLFGGLPFGGLTIITGKEGQGKSTFASQIICRALKGGHKAFIYSGEMSADSVQRVIDYQIAGAKYTFAYQKNQYSQVQYNISTTNINLIHEWYRERVFIYQEDSSFKTREKLTTVIERVITKYGVRVILIDNLMTAIALEGISGADKYERQSILARELADIAKSNNVLILLVAHKRKNSANDDDFNNNDDIAGSSDLANYASFILGYGRHKDIADSERLLTLTKNRESGKCNYSGWIMSFDERSKRIYGKNDDANYDYGWDRVGNANGDGSAFVPLDDISPFEI